MPATPTRRPISGCSTWTDRAWRATTPRASAGSIRRRQGRSDRARRPRLDGDHGSRRPQRRSRRPAPAAAGGRKGRSRPRLARLGLRVRQRRHQGRARGAGVPTGGPPPPAARWPAPRSGFSTNEGRGGVEKSSTEAIRWSSRRRAPATPTPSASSAASTAIRFVRPSPRPRRRRAWRPTASPASPSAGSHGGRERRHLRPGRARLHVLVRLRRPGQLRRVGALAPERAAAQGDSLSTSNLVKLRAGWELPPLFIGAWRQVIAADRSQEIDRLRSDGVLARAGPSDRGACAASTSTSTTARRSTSSKSAAATAT